MNETQLKLWEAVHILVTGVGPIHDRLRSAVIVLLRLMWYVPPEERGFADHPDLQKRLTEVIATLEGTIADSPVALTDDVAMKTADEIFELFCAATELADNPVGFSRLAAARSELARMKRDAGGG